MTASHNPGGIRNDFGIKYNIENGGPAPDSVSNAIYENTKKITEYRTTPKLETDRLIDIIGTTTFNVREYFKSAANRSVFIVCFRWMVVILLWKLSIPPPITCR